MPAKKTKKSSAKKNTGRKKSTKKTAKKRKITGKSCSKSKKAVKNKKSAKKQLLSFGLLQHEIDSLMEKHYKQKPDKQTQQKIMKELAEILPDEPIKPGQTKKHHHPVVKNMAKRAEYSPFVLDLSQEIAEKQKKNKEKQRIFSFFEKGQYTAPQVQETQERSEEKEKAFCRTKQAKPKLESISKIENNILAEHEEPIIEHSAKKEKQTNCDKEQFTKKPWFYHFNLPYLWHRKLAVYIAICLLIVIPIKGFGKYQKLQDSKQEIMTFATSAYEDLKIAGQALGDKNAKTASARFSNANTNLLQAEERLEKINPGIKTAINLVKQNSADIEDAKRLINTGKGITEIGKNISGLYEKFTKNNQTPLTQKVKTIRDELQKIIPKLDTINNNLNKIKISAVPKDNQEQFLQAGKFINVLTEDLKELSSFSKTINKILGEKYKKRYLFVFQNINELRPTGGFMGSLALVDINQGKIVNIEIPEGGTYDLQEWLFKKQISPYPLHVVNAEWQLQDANWFPDFPTSAKKIKWFYEEAGGPTVDGVIAINSSLIPEILKITGDIELENGKQVFTPENFTEKLQTSIKQTQKSDQNNPKKILGSLAPELLDKIFQTNGPDLLKMTKTLRLALQNKEIQMYFKNQGIQDKIKTYGWAGKLNSTSKDYLAVINSNIGGGKTDKYIKQNINLKAEINKNGQITNTVKITRSHLGKKGNQFADKNNLTFIRLYVPKGSQLVEAKGFSEIPAEMFETPENYLETDEHLKKIQGETWIEPKSGTYINNEFNKTVFGNWLSLDPGENKTVELTYRLPFEQKFPQNKIWQKIFGTEENNFYSLYWQKQSGIQNTTYNAQISLPPKTQADWIYPENIQKDKQTYSFRSQKKQDQLMVITIN